jgi:aspartate aminotransferase
VLATEQDVVLYLLDGGVAVVVGAAYGMSPYFRMSIATKLATLEEACRRMQRAVAGAAVMLRRALRARQESRDRPAFSV